MDLKTKVSTEGGLGKFTPEAYDEYAKEYRRRFPEETKPLTDEQLFAIVSHTDDDMEDANWRTLFNDSVANLTTT